MAMALAAPRYVEPPAIQENRALAPKPRWSGNLDGFRDQTGAYVADHFPPRPHLIAALNRLRMMVGVSGSPKVIVGRNGWLFYDDGSHLGGARADPPWGWDYTRSWLATLAGRTEALKARGVPYVVFVAPLKETVYPQFGPWWYRQVSPNHAAVRMPPLVEASQAGVLVSPAAALDRARDAGAPVYSRHDTHWTGYGAYVGYVALVGRLHAMGLTDAPAPLSSFEVSRPASMGETPRDLANMLGVGAWVDVRYPQLSDPADLARAKVTWLAPIQHWSQPHVIDTGAPGKPTLLITVDSFSNALLPLMYRHFSRIIVVHNQDGDWRPDLIDRYHPDVVMLEVVEGGLKFSMSGGGPPASPQALARIAAAAPFEPGDLPTFQQERPRDARRAAAARRAGHCFVDSIRLDRPAPDRWLLTTTGWQVGGEHRGFVRLRGPGGTLWSPMVFARERPDVAAVLHDPKTSASGFDQAFVIERPAPGAYAFSLYRRTPGLGRWEECQAPEPLVIPSDQP